MGYDEPWHRVHVQESGDSLCGTGSGLAIRQNRFLDESVLGDDYLRSDCRVHGFAVAQASGCSHDRKVRRRAPTINVSAPPAIMATRPQVVR